MMHTLGHLLHLYGYPLITLLVTLECCGLLVPGETLLVVAALFAAHGHLNIFAVVAAASLGAVLGNFAGYELGRVLGHTLLARHGARVGLTHKRLAVGRYMFARHGGKMVFFARFGPVLRSFSAIMAGANDMPRLPFFWWTLAGGVVWPCFPGFGVYLLGNAAKRVSGPMSIAFGVTAALAILLVILFARRNEHHLTAAALRWEAQGRA